MRSGRSKRFLTNRWSGQISEKVPSANRDVRAAHLNVQATPLAPIPPAAEDLANRRPVWDALSSLFLDTDTSLSREWRAKLLSASPYSLEQLHYMLMDEVYPVCRWNLLSVAGEWAGFDLAWLETKILRRLKSPLRFLHRANLGRVSVLVSEEWAATKHCVAAIRGDHAVA